MPVGSDISEGRRSSKEHVECMLCHKACYSDANAMMINKNKIKFTLEKVFCYQLSS